MSAIPREVKAAREHLYATMENGGMDLFEQSIGKKVRFKWVDHVNSKKWPRKSYLEYKDAQQNIRITYTHVCGTIIKHYYEAQTKDIKERERVFLLPGWKPIDRTKANTIWDKNKIFCGEWYNSKGEHIYTEHKGTSVFLYEKRKLTKLNFKGGYVHSLSKKFSELQNFHRAVAAVKLESSRKSAIETLWLAWSIKNRSGKGSFDLEQGIYINGPINAYSKDGTTTAKFNSFVRTHERFANNAETKYARFGVISASLSNNDPTKGSYQWEGIRFFCYCHSWHHWKGLKKGQYEITELKGGKKGTIFFKKASQAGHSKKTLSTKEQKKIGEKYCHGVSHPGKVWNKKGCKDDWK